MKREGRQHGMVRAYEMLSLPSNPRPGRKMINEFSSPPTAGLFTRVPTKPTNHSKYTGKCGRPRCRGCHSHPVCKSMDKVKGAHKIRSTADGPQDLKFYGFSASGVLNYLDRVDRDDGIDRDDEEVDFLEEASFDSSLVLEIEEVAVGFDVDNHAVVDDDGMGFCEVMKFVLFLELSWTKMLEVGAEPEPELALRYCPVPYLQCFFLALKSEVVLLLESA